MPRVTEWVVTRLVLVDNGAVNYPVRRLQNIVLLCMRPGPYCFVFRIYMLIPLLSEFYEFIAVINFILD